MHTWFGVSRISMSIKPVTCSDIPPDAVNQRWGNAVSDQIQRLFRVNSETHCRARSTTALPAWDGEPNGGGAIPKLENVKRGALWHLFWWERGHAERSL
jgi:hypothetical protein